MPVQFENSKPISLALNVFTVPLTPGKAALQSLLEALSGDGVESFQPTPDGGATLAGAANSPRVTVNATTRQVVMAVETWPRAVDSACKIIERINARIAAAAYVAAQAVFTTHIPVSGAGATQLLRERVLNQPAFARLGSEATATGFKVFISGPLGSLAVEPLLADDKMLFVQLARMRAAPFQLPALKPFADEVLSFNEANVRPFLAELFSDGA